TVVKGDQKHAEISAASIIAKVLRDRLMIRYAKRYPGYGFELHKGYATKSHYDAVFELGRSLIHRETFSIVRQEGLFA
ncbi:ribonuclease HII, partial [Candidatus Marinamargulisbacteria bacterium SCGC AG-439-L15]